AEPESGVEDDAADRNGGGVETPLEDVVAENARLFQVRVQILEPVPNRPWHRLNGGSRRVEDDLVQAKDAAIERLVRIGDGQRRIPGHARAGADKRRQAESAQPSDPAFNAVHALTIPLDIPRSAENSPQVPQRTSFENVLVRF